MPQFEMLVSEHKGVRDVEWGLQRDSDVRSRFNFRENHYVSYQRLLKGKHNFHTRIQTCIKDYLAGLYPHLFDNSTYFDYKVMFETDFPVDTGICLMPFWGVLEVLEKRVVNVAHLRENDIKMEPVGPGSRLHFNMVLRLSKSDINMLAMVKQEIIRTLLYNFLSGGKFTPNDTYPGHSLTNAQMIQAMEMSLDVMRLQNNTSEYNKTLTDPKLVENFVNVLDSYRQTYIFPIMKRRYLKSFQFAQFSDPYGTWTMEEITTAFSRYLINALPQRQWYDLYSLDHAYKYYEPMEAMRFREAIFSAGKYSIIMRPPAERKALPHFPLANVRIPNQIYSTSDLNWDKFYCGTPGTIRNVGNQGFYKPVTPYQNAPIAPAVSTKELGFQGWEYIMPGYSAGDTYIGEKLHADKWTLIPDFAIVPDYHVALRLINMVDPTRPTVISFQQDDSLYYNILCLPDFGGEVKMDPLAVTLQEIKPKKENCTVSGCIKHNIESSDKQDYYNFVPSYFKTCFAETNIYNYGRADVGMHSILGI